LVLWAYLLGGSFGLNPGLHLESLDLYAIIVMNMGQGRFFIEDLYSYSIVIVIVIVIISSYLIWEFLDFINHLLFSYPLLSYLLDWWVQFVKLIFIKDLIVIIVLVLILMAEFDCSFYIYLSK